MTGYHEQCLFFAPVPDLKTLYSVFLSFDSFSSQADEGELRNRQVKTCRELLHLYADLIASPILGSYGGIRVIMAITFFKRGIIQGYAQSHSLQTSSPERVLPSILQMCLSYSLTARLAPNWNRAGQYLIAGKDFLSDASKRIAVVMELSVGETELCVSVEATTVRLPPVTLKDFDVPALVMERFLNNKETVLQTKTPNNWCYILPSMKKGLVISIRRTLPPECPFQTYTELQSHWNNMYGYYLPPLNEDEVVYCSVYFKPLGEKLFTYPLCCIRIQPVQCFPRVNLQGALRAFVSDVRRLMENVCGFTAQMTSKPYYHTTSLSRPSLQDSQALPANLTSRSSSRLVLTQLPNVSPPERVPLSQLAFSPWPLSQPVSLKHNIRHSAISSVHGIPQIPNPILQSSHCHGTEACKVPSSFSSCQSFSSSSSLSTSPPSPSSSQRAIQRPKLVPVFTNKSLSRHVNITKILAEKRQQKQVEAHRVLESAVKQPSCFPLSSVPSLPRVSLPYFKKRKRDCGVYATTPAQSGFQTQPAPLTEIKTGGEVFESHIKKAKVKVQEVDVVKCARSNQLAKINVATLQAWLKGRGIAVRSKDKKDDLMSKVMQFLSEP